MLRKQREELLEDVPNEPDAAPVPDDAAVSTDNIERLTELIGQMKPMYVIRYAFWQWDIQTVRLQNRWD